MSKIKSGNLTLEKVKIKDALTLQKCAEVLSSGDGAEQMSEIIYRLLAKWARGQIDLYDENDLNLNKQIEDLTNSVFVLANAQSVNHKLHQSGRSVNDATIQVMSNLVNLVKLMQKQISDSNTVIKELSENFNNYKFNSTVDISEIKNEIKNIFSEEMKKVSVVSPNTSNEFNESLYSATKSIVSIDDDIKYSEISVSKESVEEEGESDLSDDEISQILGNMIGL